MTLHSIVTLRDTPKHRKGWGYELWVVNGEDYCGKELVLYEGKKCSIHYHKIKKETFYVIDGEMAVELYERPFEVEEDLVSTLEELHGTGQLESKTVMMLSGDSLTIDPYTPHRFVGLAPKTRFIEFSTQHFEEDSYRIWPGDSQNVNAKL